jgi:hypothetical protein
MRVSNKFNYRCAEEILQTKYPEQLHEIFAVLNDDNFELSENPNGNNSFSRQIQERFAVVFNGWDLEVSCESAVELRYDLKKGRVPVEIEIGHQRVVYADFFEFMADHSNGMIDVAVMIVVDDPNQFGHTWHCSVDSTQRKIDSIKSVYNVPTLVLGISRN